mmetsp:Transcript_17281/g.22478  ORF Transcript_17281/g.22478 Transcript_17281/m.22478 type:complete len:82 (-) Transcript_17281:96-341(-)
MESRVASLEARIEQLESDDVFASATSSADGVDRLAELSSTNAELRAAIAERNAENERLQSLLTKQEYRIMHLVRALESKYA